MQMSKTKTFNVERERGGAWVFLVITYVPVKCLDEYGPSLDKVLSELNEIKESMPAESRAGAQVFLRDDPEYQTSRLLLEVRYERPETEEETRERLDKEAEESRQMELMERQAYAKLKAKYEGS